MDNERASKRMTDVNKGTPKEKYDEGAGDNAGTKKGQRRDGERTNNCEGRHLEVAIKIKWKGQRRDTNGTTEEQQCDDGGTTKKRRR
jgi:hypothetical protein